MEEIIKNNIQINLEFTFFNFRFSVYILENEQYNSNLKKSLYK